MKTTMLQRGATMVMLGEWLAAVEGAHYNAKIDNRITDREQFTMPLKVVRQMIQNNVHAGMKAQPDRFDALEKPASSSIASVTCTRTSSLASAVTTSTQAHRHRSQAGESQWRPRRSDDFVEKASSLRMEESLNATSSSWLLGLDTTSVPMRQRLLATRSRIAWTTSLELMAKARSEGTQSMPEVSFECSGWILRLSLADPSQVPHLYCHGGDTRSSRFMSRLITLQIQAETWARSVAIKAATATWLFASRGAGKHVGKSPRSECWKLSLIHI